MRVPWNYVAVTFKCLKGRNIKFINTPHRGRDRDKVSRL